MKKRRTYKQVQKEIQTTIDKIEKLKQNKTARRLHDKLAALYVEAVFLIGEGRVKNESVKKESKK